MMKKSSRKRQRPNPVDFTRALFSDELILHIFGFLSATDLIQCNQVNKVWHRLANDAMLWKPLYDVCYNQPLTRYQTTWATPPLLGNEPDRWMAKYRLHHNWLSGFCETFTTPFEQPLTPSIRNAGHNNQVKHLIQYTHPLLCFPEHDPQQPRRVQVWLADDGHPRHIHTLADTIFDTPADTSVPIPHITCLKLVHIDMDRYLLAIGSSTGRVAVWSFQIQGENMRNKALVCQTPPGSRYTHDPVVAIDIDASILLTCTASMKLAAYDISSKQATVPKLIHSLQSTITWAPVLLNLTFSQETRQWTALLCFGMPVGIGSSSIGAQELVLTRDTVISSRHCSVLCHDRLFFTPETDTAHYPPTTCMIYSAPFLMTAHSNNTIRQYQLIAHEKHLRLKYIRTLFGHTCQVATLAIDARHGRLVSADRACVKLWDLVSLDLTKPRAQDYLITLPHDALATRNDTPSTHVDWLQVDHHQILAVIRENDTAPFVLKSWRFV
ncbi:hypothetical protein BC940DRAFT_295214 [Gongronella butleri]|nr:hypothetical protein BC940DRAFT_295214 [Gongronella butleri]